MTKLEEALVRNAHPSAVDLRSIPAFSDLPDEGIDWLASVMVLSEFEAGDLLFEAGSGAQHMFVILEGEIRAERSDGRVFTARAGQVTGVLPYSRLINYPSSSRAELRGRVALLDKQHFPEMLDRMPVLRERLVMLLSDRIRETTKADQQHEKLVALGRLSAGLAHELNNPAAAVRRATDALRQAVSRARAATREIERRGLDEPARVYLAELDCNLAKRMGPAKAIDSLDRSDQEEEFTNWLENHRVADSFELAAIFVDTGCTLDLLNEVASQVSPDLLPFVLQRVAGSLSITRLLDEVSSSTGRISELIRAIKEYSYMDQSPEQEVDLHEGLENTLVMLRHQLKNGVEVERHYDKTIPRVLVHGSELNQVWTNLITNAVDAMSGKGKLVITTLHEQRHARVDIVDSGPGIPAEIQNRIFEPFFTTKPLGQGTGLGLDAVYRIITNHRGRVEFDSHPGQTRFTVRLPLSNNGTGKSLPTLQ